MREFLEAVFRVTWRMPLIGLGLIARLFSPQTMALAGASGTGRPSEPVFSSAGETQTTPAGSGGPLPLRENQAARPAFHAGGAVNSGSLNTSRIVVIGEGLAAGMGDFTLHAEAQAWSFPAQMAAQMSADLPQRLIQPPGIGNPEGFATLPVLFPAPLQSTVLDHLPPRRVANLSVPGFRLEDALELLPVQPLIHRNDAKQTTANLIWGALPIAQGQGRLPTQVEFAAQQSPTLVVIELGYQEALEAAVRGNPDLLPEADFFVSQYRRVLARLRECGSDLLILNVPDPLDTAHFALTAGAAKLLKVDPLFLTDTYSVGPEDRLTVAGFSEISYQLFAKSIGPLPPNSILRAAPARAIGERVAAINARLAELAPAYHAVVFDLAALFRRVAREGISAGARKLTGDYLGGFYSLNGYYPGQTGHAIIANEILSLLNQRYGAAFPPIDLNMAMSSDPAAACRPAGGPDWSSQELSQLPRKSAHEQAGPSHAHPPGRSKKRDGWAPFADTPAPRLPLRLPPGLEQTLPLSKMGSYFGDGISPVNARDPQGIQWGSTGNLLFGGLALVDSHLSGSLRIRFAPPVGDVTRFQIDYTGGFAGDDSVLTTPRFFRMPFQNNRVDEVPGTISGGDLNLSTGEVSNLTIYARYSSGALMALVGTNPTFPRQPLSFPGQYGSAWATFEPRPDGLLDFSFYGSTFVPLGKDIVWPLNFTGPSGQFATIPAAGTAMHPHLSLTTKEPVCPPEECHPDIPFNTLQEFTLFTHNSAFGDAFHLNVPQLGGPAKGRAHLLGRLQIQFGEKTGNSVPTAIYPVSPGGVMAPLAASPITQIFPGRLSAGPQGFNEFLRFPLRTYPLDDLSIVGDPFDISVCAIDLGTGRSLNDLLHRAFISQDLIFALLRVEPRTPKDSFFFRGPAILIRDAENQNVFRFQGIVHIPYPPGFLFPHPDFTTAFRVGSDSALDPFLWFHAIQSEDTGQVAREGRANRVRSSTGDEFSYRYVIPAEPDQNGLVFEYENHSQQGSFRMHSLAWIDFSNSGTSAEGAEYDTVSFCGFGVWSKDGVQTLQQAAAQFSSSAEKPYAGIQIAGGDVSNVNTKPALEKNALP